MSILFAATWPERTRALILYGTYAHFHSAVLPEDRLPSVVSMMEAEWGTGGSLRFFAPGRLSDAPFRAWWARLERLGASPRTAVALTRMNAQVDVRHVLPAVRVPTLVIHRRADVRVDPEAGRFIAGRIPGARHAELPGADHPIWTGDVDSVVEEIEEFLTGTRHHPAPPPDRVLATVSVAEIAETERGAAALGEADWSARLTGWRRLAEAETTRLRGRLAGPARADGTLVAVFDGPARAVRCGAVLRDAATAHLGRPLRCGLHAGEVALTERDDASGPGICGFALHAAIRIAALARPGEILVSTTVRDLLAGSGLRFRDRDLRLALPSDAGGGRLGLLALACDGRPPERAAIPAAPMAPSPGLLPGLSPRERDVLRLVAQGLSNGAIAAELALSEHTVKRHVANILAKLSLPTRAAAAVAAARAGLL